MFVEPAVQEAVNERSDEAREVTPARGRFQSFDRLVGPGGYTRNTLKSIYTDSETIVSAIHGEVLRTRHAYPVVAPRSESVLGSPPGRGQRSWCDEVGCRTVGCRYTAHIRDRALSR